MSRMDDDPGREQDHPSLWWVVRDMARIIERLAVLRQPPACPVAAIRLHIIREGEPVPVQLKDTEKVTYGYTEQDSRGNPVAVNVGSAVWSVSDPAILALTDNGDGTASVAAAGPLGATQ